jgi:subtilase family serine protease
MLPASPQTRTAPGEQAVARVPSRDLGRRAATKPVDVVIALRFNDAAALNRLADDVSNPNSARFRHFLKPQEFLNRFAPTAAQHRRVIDALRAAGFTIDRTFENRVLIDASAPSGVAERFFATRIHDFDQGHSGTRFAAVAPVRVPASIAKLVAGVELNSLVYAHAAGGEEEEDASPKKNYIRNSGFEHRMKQWQSCGTVAPAITGQHPHAGRFDAVTGSLDATAPDVKGWSAICQLVTIPNNAKLVAFLYDQTNNPSIDDSFQAVGLMTKFGKVVTLLRKSSANHKHWIRRSFKLKDYAGQSLYVFFGVHGKGQKKYFDTQFVDSVSLTGTAPTPSPSPSPSMSPSPAPTSPVGPGKDKPLAGPTFGPAGGWAPRGVADGFDFPVQHGYGGTGVTIGIVIDQKVAPSDLDAFYANNKISAHGTVTYAPIGKPTSLPNDPTEATIDIEAVAGLAPDADVILYLTRDLSNESILNAYNQAISANKVSILNSSFGECEIQDPAFVTTSDRLATAGAAMGITFVAAAGDTGSACHDATTSGNVSGVNAPASGPHFLAVGGNQSLNTGPVSNPAVWNDRTSGLGVGVSGGGVSQSWTLPAFQQGLQGSPQSGAMRNVPDIALPAFDDDVFIYNTAQLWEGTSWSSSIATALIATSQQFCGRIGWINPAVYSEYAKHGEAVGFKDVTVGTNAGFASFSGYSATTGYDNASGIGMPTGMKFAAALCGRSTPLTLSLLSEGRSP